MKKQNPDSVAQEVAKEKAEAIDFLKRYVNEQRAWRHGQTDLVNFDKLAVEIENFLDGLANPTPHASEQEEQEGSGSETPVSTNSVVNQETGLASCPFCGTPPQFISDDLGSGIIAYQVKCIGVCPIMPCTDASYYQPDVFNWWNKRAPLTTWIRTSERAPTEKDANGFGDIWVTDYTFSEHSTPTAMSWNNTSILAWDFWMPIPALPTKEKI